MTGVWVAVLIGLALLNVFFCGANVAAGSAGLAVLNGFSAGCTAFAAFAIATADR